MSSLFAWLWIAGGLPAAVLSEVVRAESPRIARAGRIAFALLLGFDLLLAALFLSIGASGPIAHMTRSLWWATIVLAGVPLALASGLAVWRGYAGHRLALLVATLTTAALYVAFPLGFIPATQPRLTGLGRWEHTHHALGIAILLIPTLILLVNELRWKQEAPSAPEAGGPSLSSRLRAIPRRPLIGVGALLLFLIWIAGTSGYAQLLGLGVALAGSALLLWRKHRSETRRVLRDLRPHDKS